jgi:hypothetical protein
MTPDWVPQFLWLVASLAGGVLISLFIAKGQWFGTIWASFGTVVVILLGVALYLQNGVVAKRRSAESAVFTGKLVPGNDPTPWVPANKFSLMLGDDLQVLTRSSNQRVFTRNGEAFLTLRVSDGALYVSTSVFDSEGRYIVRVVDNEFQASNERAFNPRKPDEHTLVVRDSKGVEVLNVRYMNPRAIRLVGRFHLPGQREPVEVLPAEGIRWPGGGGISAMTLDVSEAPDAGVIGF